MNLCGHLQWCKGRVITYQGKKSGFKPWEHYFFLLNFMKIVSQQLIKSVEGKKKKKKRRRRKEEEEKKKKKIEQKEEKYKTL